jgi:uncharacterized Ntn-hydrolase superfamily protein
MLEVSMSALFSSRGIRIALLSMAAAVAAPAVADATWSIVLVDKKTGEVAVGCATCLEGLNLELYCPVVLVGIGTANAQSQIDSTGANRMYIWTKMQEGRAPVAIIADLSSLDPQHQNRQYGIADTNGRKTTFTGANDGQWAGGVSGRVGSVYYAIQGNVLAGQAVVDDAEQAIKDTEGDLAEKLMAAMEAAQRDGGDGRCSCDPVDPDRCGAPPPGFDPSKDKSAHIGYMIVARVGDTDGTCDATNGCANGTYYMNLNVKNQHASDPDPVIQLRGLFDDWRESWRGRPDHLLSTATLDDVSLPGNGTSTTAMTIVLNDWEGNPVGHGGATVTVAHSKNSAGLSTIGQAIDQGDGSYVVPIIAGIGQGIDEYQIVVDDGLGPVTLYPFPTLPQTPTLTADATNISASAGGTVNFSLFGPNTPPPDYVLLCSASGNSPGFQLGDLVVPLNLDDMVLISYILRDTNVFVNTDGALASDGTATAAFVVQPGDLVPLIGFELDFAYWTHGPVEFTSNYVPVTIDS